MIKAIIFDCFGVLVGRGIWKNYEHAGGDLISDKQELDDLIEKDSTGLITNDEFSKALANMLGLSVEEWKKILDLDESPNYETFIYIKSIKGKYKIGLLSNVNKGVIERKIPSDLLALFDATILSFEAGLNKPDPKIFKLAAEKLGVKPEEVLFVDDHAEYLDGARETGMKDHLFTSVGDLKKAVSNL